MKSRLLPNSGISVANVSGNYSKVESDEIGNITSYDGFNYTWVGRQLKSVSLVGDSSVGATYSYNSDGQRIGKNIALDDGETYDYNYYYNGNILAGYKLVITKSDGSSTTHNVAFMYDENGEAFGFNYNGNDYYYVRNAQNDVIFISNSDNTGVVMYQYDAWGNMTACYDTSDDGMLSIINPYTYRGYFYEIETNTYFLESRYYNPELCRFISADDTSLLELTTGNIHGANLFAYCGNDPINDIDPNGYLSVKAAGYIIDGVLLAINIASSALALKASIKAIRIISKEFVRLTKKKIVNMLRPLLGTISKAVIGFAVPALQSVAAYAVDLFFDMSFGYAIALAIYKYVPASRRVLTR